MSLEEGRRVGSSFFAARATQGDDIRVNVPSLLLLLLFFLLLFFARVPVSSGERARKKCGFLCRRQREREKEKEKWKKNYVLFANYQMRLKSESRLYVNASHVPDSMLDVARTVLPSLSLSLTCLPRQSRSRFGSTPSRLNASAFRFF